MEERSDGESDDSLVLIAFDKVVYEICIEESLNNSCNERYED